MDVLNAYIDMETTRSILKKHNVGYIVLNETFDAPIDGADWSVKPQMYDRTRQKLDAHPDMFQLIYQEAKLRIYKYDQNRDITDPQIVEPIDFPFSSDEEPPLHGAVNATFYDQFVLIGAVADKDTVARGDVLGVKCYWKTLRESTSSEYYKVFVRADTKYNKNALYSEYWSKIYRKVLERINGERYRFRSDHNPVNGLYPPNSWRLGEVVLDEFSVTIPADVSVGTYDIKITLLEVPLGPNYYLSDYLRDDDIYNGVKVGSIVVK